MTKTLQYTLPFFVTNRQRDKEKRGQKIKVRTMITMHEGCEMNEKMKLKPKTKQNATKYKVNMTCYDEETRYRPMHDKGSKGVCKR